MCEFDNLLLPPLILICGSSQEELRSHLNIFLDALMTVDPSKIVSKAKCHIITHIVDDIRRFGPAVTLSTETFESFNGVFRLCSVLSNRHAPSRDIALHMADMARFKHVASGGKWREEWGWTSAGDSVRRFLRVNAHLQDLLGWRNAKADQTGTTFIFEIYRIFGFNAYI